MAWTTPPTFVSGNVLTAAQLNALTGDLALTLPALATVLYDNPGSSSFGITENYSQMSTPAWGVSTGAHAVSMRQPVSSVELYAGTTTSTTAVGVLLSPSSPLGTSFGPSVTVTTGTSALVCMTATCQNDTNAKFATVTYGVNGGTGTQNYISLFTAAAGQQMTAASFHMETGLTAGANAFSMQYAVSTASTGTFNRRYLTVIPF